MQTLSSLLNPVTAKIKAEVEAKANPPEKTFHEREIDRMNADPANGTLIQARARGLKAASDFIKAASDSTHPNHKNAFPEFRTRFNLDSKKVENHFIAVASKELGARPYELQDPSYESALIRAYAPSTVTDLTTQSMYNLFCEGMRKKWSESGYSRDAEVVAELAVTYGMKKRDHQLEYKQFEPKN